MKHMKKLFSLLLALVMILGLTTTAFAQQEGELSGGSITINKAVAGQDYHIYQLLYLESYNPASNAYAYKANSAWADWLKTQTAYVAIDEQGYVTWVEGASAADFAKAAQAHAKAENIAPDLSNTATANAPVVKFENLKLGYYLVDTTLGTLCSLDTTNPSVTMEEKNQAPSNVKTVEEDSNKQYGQTNDADIGQTVKFQSTITAQAGAENYVFHDKMSAGLTYTGVTGITLNGETVDASNYTVNAPANDGDTFDVVFTQDFCDTLKANDKIVISYTATVNENAVIGGEGNTNESKVSYGDENNSTTTPPSVTRTYTWDVDVFKYTKDGGSEKALADAKFTLSKNEDGSDPIGLVSEGGNVYRVATAGDTGIITEITTDDTGRFTIKGLDSDTYYLTEIAAPEGYNKLAAPITIVIGSNGEVNATEDAPQGVEVIKVLNQSGSELPSTGGTGTTIFYVVGSIMLIGAAILLISKKRMSVKK